MGMDDKMKHSAEGSLGKAKEKLGDATDDHSLENEGKKDQSKADLKQAGDKVKDAFNK
ncbi:MAG TPA: CsbD family protein [Nocardioidaceae bacterium]